MRLTKKALLLLRLTEKYSFTLSKPLIPQHFSLTIFISS